MCLMSPPLRCSILCERDSLIAKCGTFFFLSSFLHLFSDPDIATEHMYCIAGQTLSSHGPSPALLLNHCACEALYRKDCLHTAGVWSLSLEQGGGEDAIHFVLPLALLSGTWAVF